MRGGRKDPQIKDLRHRSMAAWQRTVGEEKWQRWDESHTAKPTRVHGGTEGGTPEGTLIQRGRGRTLVTLSPAGGLSDPGSGQLSSWQQAANKQASNQYSGPEDRTKNSKWIFELAHRKKGSK